MVLSGKKGKFKVAIISLCMSLLIVAGSVFVGCSNNKRTQDIVILCTNDVHCELDGKVGYEALAAYKKECLQKTPYVSLVDIGDSVSGGIVGMLSKGEYMVNIMNDVGYDMEVLGNHEFDFGMERLAQLMDQSKFPYLACNITYTGKKQNPISKVKPYEIKQYGSTKVGFVGVATPASITTSAPTNFMEDGQYAYDLCLNDDERFYNTVQKNIDECKKLGAEYVVLLTHLGDDTGTISSKTLIEKTSGAIATLDGHAHHVIPSETINNKEGKPVLLTSSGQHLDQFGKLTITPEGQASVEIISEYGKKDPEATESVNKIKTKLENDLGQTVGTSDADLTTHNADGAFVGMNRETNIGDFVADVYRKDLGADIGLVNGGGVKADNIAKGNITMKDLVSINPFGNKIVMCSVTGQNIKDALEMGCRKVTQNMGTKDAPVTSPGFFQVSGLKFTVDTSVNSSVQLDDKNKFKSVAGEYRVKDLQVLNKQGGYDPIDLNKKYSVVSNDFLLQQSGSGMSMFSNSELLVDTSKPDYEILAEGLKGPMKGKIGQEYATTQDRIVVK